MEENSNLNKAALIGEGFCFRPENYFSAKLYHKALDEYNKSLNEAINLEGTCPIFLDTNVLLDFYKLSFTERDELLKFFEINKSRIWITSKIEEEFLKHRIDHIRNYLKSLDEFVNAYKNIKEELDRLKEGSIKGFDHYLENNIILKNDYQDLRNELKTLNDSIKSKLTSLFSDEDFEAKFIEKEKRIQEIRLRLEEQANIERQDPLLALVSEFNVTEQLNQQETEFLMKHFDSLRAEYEKCKGDNSQNWKFTFPGCGETKEKPYGDFIIYHQILKFMKENDSNATFLTNDVQKNDWLYRNKTELIPYTHYITNSYVNTAKTLYIFQAKDKIRISYDPVYVDQIMNQELGQEVVSVDPNKSESPEVRIVGKIDLTQKDFNGNRFVDSWYDSISEEDFMRELAASEKWAIKYGDGFVGVRSFITKYLGSKGYHYKSTYDLKERLENEGKIEIYTHVPDNPIYNSVEAIKIRN